MNGRVQGDGSIVFPMRGEPPSPVPPGYHADPHDAYKWIMDYCPCKHRVQKVVKCLSGRTALRDYCTLMQLQVNPRYCNQDCKVQDKT